MRITRFELLQIQAPRSGGQIPGYVLANMGVGPGAEIDEAKLRALTVATA